MTYVSAQAPRSGSIPRRRGRSGALHGISHVALAIPVGLALSALFALFFGSWPLFGLLLTGPCVVSAALLLRMLFSEELRIGQLIACGTALWYFLPVIAGSIPGSGFLLPDSISVTAVSSGIIAVSLALMLIVERLFFPNPFVVRTEEHADLPAGAVFLGIGSAALALLMATGQWTFGTGQNTGVIGPHLMVAGAMAAVTPPLAARLLAMFLRSPTRQRRFSQVAIYLAALAVGLAWQLVAGRRAFALSLFLTALSFAAAYWRRTITPKRIVLGALIALALAVPVSSAWRVFFAVRVANYGVARGQAAPSFTSALKAASEVDQRVVDAGFSGNVKTRGLIISSVNLFRETAHGRLGGVGLVDSFLEAVPSIVFPGKREWEATHGTTELLWTERLSAPLTDYATTLFLDSYADLGVFGLTAYFAIIYLITAGFMRLAAGAPNGPIIVLTGVLMMLMSVEDSFAAFLAGGRNLALLLLVYWAIRSFVARAFHGRPRRRWARLPSTQAHGPPCSGSGPLRP